MIKLCRGHLFIRDRDWREGPEDGIIRIHTSLCCHGFVLPRRNVRCDGDHGHEDNDAEECRAYRASDPSPLDSQLQLMPQMHPNSKKVHSKTMSSHWYYWGQNDTMSKKMV